MIKRYASLADETFLAGVSHISICCEENPQHVTYELDYFRAGNARIRIIFNRPVVYSCRFVHHFETKGGKSLVSSEKLFRFLVTCMPEVNSTPSGLIYKFGLCGTLERRKVERY